MRRTFYPRLALRNLLRNRQTSLPFIAASAALTFSVYSFSMMVFDEGLPKMRGGGTFAALLVLGLIVVALFATIFLFYANSYLIRRRKKELGLYSVLGMEKKHIARVLVDELLLSGAISLICGLGLGILLARLLFLVVRALIRVEVTLTGAVNPWALLVTGALFAVIYLLLILCDVIQVGKCSPVELISGQQTGEREPKAKWLLAVLGVACMGAGYLIAQRVSNPVQAILLFFVAVLLVIAGTYLLFVTGSVAVLKLLKKKKTFYYKPAHFITVSGLLYRMKQNAAGMASIAILCTMAMITIGTTVSMYLGSEKMFVTLYPCDWQATVYAAQDARSLEQSAREASAQTGVPLVDFAAYRGWEATYRVAGDGAATPMESEMLENPSDLDSFWDALIMTQDDLRALEGNEVRLNLSENELGWYGDGAPLAEISFGGARYTVRAVESLPVVPLHSAGSLLSRALIIAPNEQAARAVALIGEREDPVYTAQWNLDGGREQKAAFGEAFEKLIADGRHSTRNRPELAEEWYAMYGGFLFIGIFLGAIFMMGTALIICFKQLSEGYQDHDRFIILQKVGMSQAEVKKTVNRQIVWVFFLPLAVAVCHVLGSLHMIILMLRTFSLTDEPFIMLNTLCAAALVAAIYLLVYRRTAKSYYRLVRFN